MSVHGHHSNRGLLDACACMIATASYCHPYCTSLFGNKHVQYAMLAANWANALIDASMLVALLTVLLGALFGACKAF
jgi:hypothetical protein